MAPRSNDAGDEGDISGWVSLNEQVTDTKSHTFVRNSYTRFAPDRPSRAVAACLPYYVALKYKD
jgi:hypothetical protein